MKKTFVAILLLYPCLIYSQNNLLNDMLCEKVSDWAPIEAELVDSLTLIDRTLAENEIDTSEIKIVSNETFFAIQGQKILYPKEVFELYQLRACRTIWYSTENMLDYADTLIQHLQTADFDGLNPNHYHLTQLLDLYQKINFSLKVNYTIKDTSSLLDFELLMTDAAIAYSKDLRIGKISPNSIEQHFEIERDTAYVADDLAYALNNSSIQAYYQNIAPHYNQYEKLKCVLGEYLEKEPWDSISCELTLKVGMKHDHVADLRKRLGFENTSPNDIKFDTLFYTAPNNPTIIDSFSLVPADSIFNPFVYDSLLYQQVNQFQSHHGLEPDGEVGPATFDQLNVPLEKRIEQLSVNLERWRWMPREIGNRYIIVNIAGYYLQFYDEDTISFTKKVVVGKPYTRTPVFSDQMRYLELNPYWTAPYSISSREILPKLKKDPSYLARNEMVLFKAGKEVDPFSVDWSMISRSNFPYVVRQSPGYKNALGAVKFMFPNQYNVYIHDTPSKSRFEEMYRPFSHGCVRLHEPIQMAEHILADTKWTPKKIKQQLNKRKNKRINLDEPIPVYIMYWTVWVNDDGIPYFMEDIYNRDEKVINTYFEKKE